MTTAKVTYSDKFTQDVKSHFQGNDKIIKAVDEGSPFLGDLMATEASTIHNLYLAWAKGMSAHFEKSDN